LHILAPLADVFKALADPTRRKILDELTDRDGQTLFELITTRREGRCKYHDIEPEPLRHIAERWLRTED
jgi:DNA-binding transcriptional ArsR family regulator